MEHQSTNNKQTGIFAQIFTPEEEPDFTEKEVAAFLKRSGAVFGSGMFVLALLILWCSL